MKNLLSQDEMNAIIEGNHDNVFAVLGPHKDKGSKNIFIRAFLPHAAKVSVISKEGQNLGQMTKLDDRGFYQIEFGKVESFAYHFLIENDIGQTYEAEDVYRFGSTLGDIDEYLFSEGNHHQIYQKLGAHIIEMDGISGVAFAVWAPNARRVSVVGDFNFWDGCRNASALHPTLLGNRTMAAAMWLSSVPERKAVFQWTMAFALEC